MGEGVEVPAWYDPVKDRRAVLDLRLEAGPDMPIQYVDVRITHPVTGSGEPSPPEAARKACVAAEKRASGKHTRYPPTRNTAPLFPFVMETYGAWCKEATELFGQAAARVANNTAGSDARKARCRAGWTACWRARLHCAMQQDNVGMLLAAVRDPKRPCSDTGPH